MTEPDIVIIEVTSEVCSQLWIIRIDWVCETYLSSKDTIIGEAFFFFPFKNKMRYFPVDRLGIMFIGSVK